MKCPRCETHIDKHEANRCLDAWVAEKVMGKKPGARPPWYSTRIADAWLVVEKLANEGFCPALIYDDDGSWTMAFDGIQNLPEDDEPLITSFCIEAKMIADTAPLAICLAAIKAIE